MQPEKLKIKLEHWAGHNSSHAAGFRKQAQEAGEMGQQDIEAELLLAAEAMDMAGSHLQRAIEILGDTQD
ncbi:MAG: hypothetical protein K8R34_13165 [Methanosarcinales archaeon]|nr:hypothetical protein [Methanosarcinales archaeon]MCD4810472.1 hypothetical protein [Methanosarcinales archaeon]